MIKPLFLFCIAVLVLAPTAALGQTFTVSSPNGQVTATIKITGGSVFYSLTRGAQTVVDDSRLGLILDNSGAEDLGAGIASLTASGITTVNQTYATLGWHPTAVNNYNSRTFTITKAGGNNDSAVEFRVFNDGLAFRYTIPTESGSGPRTVLGEATQWKLPTTATSGWYQQGANGDYENAWATAPVSATSGTDMEGDDRLMGPVVVNYGANGYAAIGESDYWGYSGMTFIGSGNNTRAIQAAFIRDTAGWQVSSGSNSPWRTIVTAPNLNGLVNSDMTHNVARPADAALFPNGVNTSWILTGRSLWSWLDRMNVNSDGSPSTGNGVNETNIKQYVDKAQELGFEYVTVDSGWRNWGGGGNGAFTALQGVVDYAHARGIKIIAWKDSHDFYSGDLVTGDFSVPNMIAFLNQLDATGADGVKMDFLRQTGHLVGEYQRLLNFMTTTYTEAAARQLVVDFHGAPKTAGQTISYPNGLTTEHVRGLEGGAVASHDATLPFTTLLAGPADYTPGLFSIADDPGTPSFDENGRRDNTTWSHQMAMGVLITSPIIHWASGPNTINNALPDGSAQLEVFKAIPATWDETVVLDISQIGTLAAFARRDGDTWFLAMVSGDATNEMTINSIDLSFLGDGVYEAILLRDSLGVDTAIDDLTVPLLTQSYNLDVTMRRGGGFVAMFSLVPEPGTFGLLGIGIAALLWRYRRLARVAGG